MRCSLSNIGFNTPETRVLGDPDPFKTASPPSTLSSTSMANSKNPHKLPRRARVLLTRAISTDLPASLIEWVSEALVTGTIPQHRPQQLNYPKPGPTHDKDAALYGIASDLWYLNDLVYHRALKAPWKAKRAAMRLTNLEHSLYKYEIL
jgi:hypothetical protein